MKKFNLLTAVAIASLTAGLMGGSAFAQTGTAMKESGKAVAEKAKEGKENVQAAVASESAATTLSRFRMAIRMLISLRVAVR